MQKKEVKLKINAPFIICISKINVVMPMYNSLEYSKNYKKTRGSSLNYYRNEPSDAFSFNSESFNYKTNYRRDL